MVTAFQNRVYELTRAIPRGKVATYADLAHALGIAGYRSVGTALARNPEIPATPCHRVVKSDGTVGKYAHDTPQKIALLRSEGIIIADDGTIADFANVRFQFT